MKKLILITTIVSSLLNLQVIGNQTFPNGLQLLDQIEQKSRDGDYRGATEDLICYDLLVAMDGQCLKDPKNNSALQTAHNLFLDTDRQEHEGLQIHFEEMSRDERFEIMKNQHARVSGALTFNELQGPEWLYELNTAKLLKQPKNDQFTCKKECDQSRRAYLDAYAGYLNKQIATKRNASARSKS